MRFFFSSRRRHTRLVSDWSSDVCSSDLVDVVATDPDYQLARPVEVLEGQFLSDLDYQHSSDRKSVV